MTSDCLRLSSAFFAAVLFSAIQRLHDRPVTLDIHLFQIIEQFAAFTYQAQQRALRAVVVAIALQVFRKVVDTVGKERDLALRRTGVGRRSTVLSKKLLLLLSC